MGEIIEYSNLQYVNRPLRFAFVDVFFFNLLILFRSHKTDKALSEILYYGARNGNFMFSVYDIYHVKNIATFLLVWFRRIIHIPFKSHVILLFMKVLFSPKIYSHPINNIRIGKLFAKENLFNLNLNFLRAYLGVRNNAEVRTQVILYSLSWSWKRNSAY